MKLKLKSGTTKTKGHTGKRTMAMLSPTDHTNGGAGLQEPAESMVLSTWEVWPDCGTITGSSRGQRKHGPDDLQTTSKVGGAPKQEQISKRI